MRFWIPAWRGDDVLLVPRGPTPITQGGVNGQYSRIDRRARALDTHELRRARGEARAFAVEPRPQPAHVRPRDAHEVDGFAQREDARAHVVGRGAVAMGLAGRCE